MQLKLRRSQKQGMLGMGKVAFGLEAQVALTPDEADNVKKYKMGKEVLYQNYQVEEKGAGLLGVASRIAIRALNISITIDDLVNGKQIECKDILEMRAVEDQIREACGVFKEILESAAGFEGEEVIEF